MTDWQPISKDLLLDRIAQGESRMTPSEARLWAAIRIEPVKWLQHPYGDGGNGFWVIGIVGSTVIWYNDIEDGFNRSGYSRFGQIDDYWCNQDELEITVRDFMRTLKTGVDLVRVRMP